MKENCVGRMKRIDGKKKIADLIVKQNTKQEPAIDKVYTPVLITLAKGKYCNLYGNYITEDEAEHKDFMCKTKTRK